MKLYEAKDWKAVHFGNRTILSSDRNLYPESVWRDIISTEVVQTKQKGHYKAI